MRNLRRLGTAVVLTLVLALPASAGYISTGKSDPPPPPAPTTVAADEMSGGETSAERDETSDSLTGAMLTLSGLVLSLF